MGTREVKVMARAAKTKIGRQRKGYVPIARRSTRGWWMTIVRKSQKLVQTRISGGRKRVPKNDREEKILTHVHLL